MALRKFVGPLFRCIIPDELRGSYLCFVAKCMVKYVVQHKLLF